MSEPFGDDENACIYTRGVRAWSATDLVWKVTHVIPFDVVLHELGDGCVCGVSQSVVCTVAEGDWLVVKHHALA